MVMSSFCLAPAVCTSTDLSRRSISTRGEPEPTSYRALVIPLAPNNSSRTLLASVIPSE